MTKPPLERAARALCLVQGLPENTKFEGRPMWESFLPNSRVALDAIRKPSDRMIHASLTVELPGGRRLTELEAMLVWERMIDVAVSE